MYDIPIILASASPRRSELLARAGFSFEAIAACGEEIITSDDPGQVVMSLAKQKASEVSQRIAQDPAVVIGADTIVVREGKILGKPRDEEDAFRMLSMLQDSAHQVYTGVCLILQQAGTQTVRVFCEITDVYFKPMSERQIRDYIATGDPMDKAGAYGIQSGAGQYIERIEGDYDNVVGLPVQRLKEELDTLMAEAGPEQKRRVCEVVRRQRDHVPLPPVKRRENAVLLPLLETADGYDILFEKRALHLRHQPGDICLPGGGIKEGETPLEAALRETREELLVERDQIELLFPMDGLIGPRDRTVWPAAARIRDYRGTFSAQEVDHTFRVPLSFFLENPPRVYRGRRTTVPIGDFPFDEIPGGRSYWKNDYEYDILFYNYDGNAIWGVTARIVDAFVKLYRGEKEDAPAFV